MDMTISGSLVKFLKNDRWDSLDRIYSNPNIIDGMQFYFEISYGDKRDTTQLNNVWVPSLYKLAQIVNSAVPDSLRFDLRVPKWNVSAP